MLTFSTAVTVSDQYKEIENYNGQRQMQLRILTILLRLFNNKSGNRSRFFY